MGQKKSMEPWMGYKARKAQCFRDMYEARRRILKFKRDWLHPIEDVGVAYDDQGWGRDDSLPDLYHLIDNAIFLILAAGKSPEPGFSNAAREIETILAQGPIDGLIAQLPEDEQRELRIDLEILGFIPADIIKPRGILG